MRLRVAIPSLAVLSVVGAAAGARMVEADLEDRAGTALAAGGLTDVSTRFSGDDAVIRGAIVRRAEALRVVAGIPEVGSVRFESVVSSPAQTPPPRVLTTTPPEAPEPPVVDLSVEFDGVSIVLGGSVATEAQRRSLVSAAGAVVGGTGVVDRLVVGTNGSTRELDSAVAAVARLFPVLPTSLRRADVRLRAEQLTLTGTPTPGGQAAVVEALAGAEKAGLTVRRVLGTARVGQAIEAIIRSTGTASIRFAEGASTLTPAAEESLGVLAARLPAALVEAPDARIEIRGHTDGQGEARQSTALSRSRADVVRDHLVGRGVDADRLVALGRADADPAATNATAEGRERNRRAELAVVGP